MFYLEKPFALIIEITLLVYLALFLYFGKELRSYEFYSSKWNLLSFCCMQRMTLKVRGGQNKTRQSLADEVVIGQRLYTRHSVNSWQKRDSACPEGAYSQLEKSKPFPSVIKYYLIYPNLICPSHFWDLAQKSSLLFLTASGSGLVQPLDQPAKLFSASTGGKEWANFAFVMAGSRSQHAQARQWSCHLGFGAIKKN